MGGKSKSVPVSNPDEQRARSRSNNDSNQPVAHSGSKKTKQANHVSHNNPQG
ncbi:small acid-soluble spore protein P [Paenibacillus albus]|uniref:Small acid-soluble spore protein P n=1 Tax=Paenibacillus albus TaxID=2495582 RepID=A0A3Q8X2I4_9BACL|nr:small acid-soluble spore protein P [Paenibacillus albus]AZN38950.1 small acid-soluble spore protein P [Paenibacillus albus]